MDKDSMALLKFAIAVAIIAILLVVWFMTIGAPAGEEEEAAVAMASGYLPADYAGLIPL